MAAMPHPPPPGAAPFVIYEDAEDRTPLSPSDGFERDLSFNSDLSLPLGDDAAGMDLDQELDDEPLPYRSSYTSRKSGAKPRRSSGATQYSLISAIPSETSIFSRPVAPASPAMDAKYAPQKERPRFRNPESVRAMQMASPPPLLDCEASRERMKGAYKLGTPSRSGTPVSRPSGSRRGSVREQHSPRPTPGPQQAPLVLLHVTILPMQVPFSHDLMVKVMPEWMVENYKLLEDKLQDIILMRRGLLIPHPRDEYDLLEERILESLDLKLPRLLKCGHFVPPEDDSDKEDEDDASSANGGSTGRGRRMSGGTLTEEGKWEEHMHQVDDEGVCADCHRELKRPGKGVGAGSRKWDVKIYAANGLMRSAAWTACWNDMERCDVEISPWIPEQVRRTLERRVQEEQEADKRKQMYAIELQRQIQDANAKQRILEEDAVEIRRREEEEKRKTSAAAAAAALERSLEEMAAEKKRVEEVLEEKIREAKEAVRLELEAHAAAEAKAVAERFRALEAAMQEQKNAEPALSSRRKSSVASASGPQSRPRQPSRSEQSHDTDIPLSVLLKNYILILLGDQRNLIILVLSATVIFLAMNMNVAGKQNLSSLQVTGGASDARQIVAVTATTTATSFSTLTVTQVQTAVVGQSTAGSALGLKKTTASMAESSFESSTPGHRAICEPEAIFFHTPNLFCTTCTIPPRSNEHISYVTTNTSPHVDRQP